MTPIEFEGQTVVIAKDQPQYLPLPARRVANDPEGRVTCCWQLTPEERAVVARTGQIWQQVLTFGDPLQPQILSVLRPFEVG